MDDFGLLGVLLATAITAVIQSSGATIGMCFALIQADVFTSIEQTFPIVLGAHIGTCSKKLERHASKVPEFSTPTLVDPHDYLDRLQSEEDL